MLSNTLVNEIASAGLGLTKGMDLFAEQGTGDRYVVVKTTSPMGYEGVPVRLASVQVLVKGWTHQAGYLLAERIAQVLAAMTGERTFETETYHLYGVQVRYYPYGFMDNGVLSFTTNLSVSYRQAIA